MYTNEYQRDEKVANFCFMAHSDKEDEVMGLRVTKRMKKTR